MKVTAKTKNSDHEFKNGKWEPPIVVPTEIHEQALRNINQSRSMRDNDLDINSKTIH